MSKSSLITLDTLERVDSIDPNNIYKAMKINNLLEFANEKQANKGITKRQICGKLGISQSSIDRSIVDLNMNHGFYNYDVSLKKGKGKGASSTTSTQPVYHKCTECNKSFQTEPALKGHMTKKHKKINEVSNDQVNIQGRGDDEPNHALDLLKLSVEEFALLKQKQQELQQPTTESKLARNSIEKQLAKKQQFTHQDPEDEIDQELLQEFKSKLPQ